MKITIEKGDRFKCKRNVGERTPYYIKGKEYVSSRTGCITDEEGYEYHFWDEAGAIFKYFTYIGR